MLEYVFLILSCVVAANTNPTKESFEVFFLSSSGSTKTLSGSVATAAAISPVAYSVSSEAGTSTKPGSWFTRNILNPISGAMGFAPRVPDHTVKDYTLFSIAKLNNGAGTYLGMFGAWWVLSEVVGIRKNCSSRGSSGPLGGLRSSTLEGTVGELDQGDMTLETEAIHNKELAIQAKVRKDHKGAAKYYIVAAKKYEQSGSPFNLQEAASAYEDAYKAFSFIKQTANAAECLEKAARLFNTRTSGGTSRAAKVYDTLGDIYKAGGSDLEANPAKAAMCYKQAAVLYSQDADGRALFATIRHTDMMCELGEWAEAQTQYEEVIMPTSARDDMLAYVIKDHAFHSLLCTLGASKGDWVLVKRKLQEYQDHYPTFLNSRGEQLFQNLLVAKENEDAEAFSNACRRYDSLSALKPWQVALLAEERRRIDKNDLL